MVKYWCPHQYPNLEKNLPNRSSARLGVFRGIAILKHPQPICSMYGIFTYIWLKFIVHVGNYSMHGAFGQDAQQHGAQKHGGKMMEVELEPDFCL